MGVYAEALLELFGIDFGRLVLKLGELVGLVELVPTLAFEVGEVGCAGAVDLACDALTLGDCLKHGLGVVKVLVKHGKGCILGLGIELAQFCTAARLDGAPPEPWELPVERCLSASSRFVLHGPFNELTPAAIDPLVLDGTKKRYRQAIKKAHTMGIQKIVLHAGFLPLVYYPEWFVERSAAVWRELLCDVPDDMTVCLENVLEPEPQLLTAITEAVHDPRLRICLDLGHANTCASALPPENWLRACAPYLSHVHLHNNQGDRDLHAALFDGVMDIAGLLSLLEALSPQATCTLELTQDRPSLDWLVEKHLLE